MNRRPYLLVLDLLLSIISEVFYLLIFRALVMLRIQSAQHANVLFKAPLELVLDIHPVVVLLLTSPLELSSFLLRSLWKDIHSR